MENNPLGVSERYGVQRRRVRRILVHLEFKVILQAGDDALRVQGGRRGESGGEGLQDDSRVSAGIAVA